MTQKILIDTDPGIDDAMAIVYALSDPELELVGLTTVFGNVAVAQATRNALALVSYLDRIVPVAEGAARPLEQEPLPHPDFVHGADGYGGVALPASEAVVDSLDAAAFIIDALKANPGELILIPVGPLTNIAEALRRDPSIASLAKMVIVMGGAYGRGGNVTAHAEANIWQDPHAAEIVLNTRWPLHLVGLNVTEEVRCTQSDFDVLATLKPIAGSFLRDAVSFYIKFHRDRVGIDGCFLHDPSAVIAAVAPDFFETEDIPLMVNCAGAEIGATVAADDGRAPVKVSLAVDDVRLRRRFLDVIGQGPLS